MTAATKLALALLGVSLVTLLVVSARTPLGPANSDYAALVNQAEDLVRTVARDGLGAFGRSEVRNHVEQLTKRPLTPLLSAWSALSLGRVGLLAASSSVRLPWLILAGLMPLSVFLVLRDRYGVRAALGAACWLLLSPGFIDSALAVRLDALGVWSGWLPLAAYAWSERERTLHARRELLAACGVLGLIAFGLSLEALWVLPLILVHALSVRGAQNLRASERGQVLIPATALLLIAVLPVAMVACDPMLWHADAPTIIRRVFDEEDPASSVTSRFAPFFVPALLSLCGLVALALHGLARRFATGQYRPARDRSGIGLLLGLGLLCAALCAWFGASSGRQFAVELLRPFLACLVGIGAATLSSRFATRHAQFAEAGLLVLALLVR
jgi:hypothetical protein